MAIVEDSQNQTFLKFLIPNKAAGLIIGKAGASIVELQNATGAIIKVNNATQGVTERVLIVAGTADNIRNALNKVLTSVRDAEVDAATGASPATTDITVRVLVPPAAAPVIIGHAGSTIKELQTTTSTTVKIANRQNVPAGRRPSVTEEDDRQVTVSGSLEKVQAAVSQVITFTSKYARYESEVTLRETLSKATRQTTAASTTEYPPALYATNCTIEFFVANEEAGAIIGRNGRRIRELGHRVQASVARHDEVDAENRRKVTLTGPVQHVHKAHLEVLNWVREHREVANQNGQSNTGSAVAASNTGARAATNQVQAPAGMIPGINTFTMMPQFHIQGYPHHQM